MLAVRRFAVVALAGCLSCLAACETEWSEVTVGASYACGIDRAGATSCWGSAGMVVPDLNGLQATDVCAANTGVCLVLADGTLHCDLPAEGGWVPQALPEGAFASVDCGASSVCALSPGGSAVCRDFDSPWSPMFAGAVLDEVAANAGHACGSADGTVTCRVIPSDVDVEARLQPPSVRLWNLTGFSGHMCGLETDGRAHCWMDPDLDAYALRAPSEEPFLSISAGGGHTCGVFQTGEVECLGDGVPNEAEVESWFGEGAAVIGISTAATQACIWTEAGQAACWGLNERAEDWIVPTSVR